MIENIIESESYIGSIYYHANPVYDDEESLEFTLLKYDLDPIPIFRYVKKRIVHANWFALRCRPKGICSEHTGAFHSDKWRDVNTFKELPHRDFLAMNEWLEQIQFAKELGKL